MAGAMAGDASQLARFEDAIGALEDAVMDEAFRERLNGFCVDNCDSFDLPATGTESEYKLEWTPLFEAYTTMLESHIGDSLGKAIEGFTMEWFLEALAQQADAGGAEGEIFDLLLSLGDFEEFISLMRSHKQEKLARAAGGSETLSFAATAAAGLAPLVSSMAASGDETTSPSAAGTASPADP